MNAQFKATNPDQIPFTMEVTLSLKGWKTLKDNIGPLSSYETGEVYDAIGKMIDQAERTYYPEVVEK